MAHRSGWMFLGASALTGLLAVWSSLAGCRSDDTSGSSLNAGGSGGSGSGSTVSSTSSTTTGGSSVSSSSGGATPPKVVTIKDITTGVVGPKTSVKLAGVVAMSQKLFVSKGSTSGSCLWGVFVSEPSLTETAPNTGTLVLSYGTKASIPAGGTTAACPRLGVDATGDNIPDDIKAGDVVDVVGSTDYFLLTQCTKPTDSKVAEFQVAQATVTKTGMTAPLPTPHALTADEITKLVSQSDKAFYDQWGGVKVRLQNVTSVPQMLADVDGGMTSSVVDKFGHMVLAGSNLQVGDKIYFRSGAADPKAYCHKAPVYPPTTTFTAVDGIMYLDFCTWSVQPNDKCADIAPPSADALDCNNSAEACK